MIKTSEKLSPKQLLSKYLATHNVPIAKSKEELFEHSVKDDNGEEIEEFLRWREELRKENAERSFE
jgi:hypothetical protein